MDPAVSDTPNAAWAPPPPPNLPAPVPTYPAVYNPYSMSTVMVSLLMTIQKSICSLYLYLRCKTVCHSTSPTVPRKVTVFLPDATVPHHADLQLFRTSRAFRHFEPSDQHSGRESARDHWPTWSWQWGTVTRSYLKTIPFHPSPTIVYPAHLDLWQNFKRNIYIKRIQ